MNERIYPGDTVDWFAFEMNQRKFTLEDLLPYEGKHVAWSLDGTRILASGADMDEVDKHLVESGIDPAEVLHSFVEIP